MKRIIKILSTPTARSSVFYFFGHFAINVGRYFFHLLLLRLLLPAQYGEFLAYLSFLYLLGIPNTTVSSVVVKFVAEFKGKRDHRSINELFYYIIRKLAPISLVLGIFLILLAGPLSVSFKAHPTAFTILGLSLLIGLVSTVVRSYLLAFQRFTAQILVGFLETLLTLVLAFFFIKIGLSATGAVLAQILAGMAGVVISFILINKAVLPARLQSHRTFSLGTFTGYSLINAVGSLSLISSDVILVRYFFDEHLSGIYSSLSVIGRIIYFGLGPLIALILPVATHRHAATGSSRGVFVKLGTVTLIFGSFATLVFSLFPELIIRTLSGANYLAAAVYLPIFAVSMLFFSLSLFIITYSMATGKPKRNMYLLAAAVIQPVLILFFHQSLGQIVWLNLILEGVLLSSLIWTFSRDF